MSQNTSNFTTDLSKSFYESPQNECSDNVLSKDRESCDDSVNYMKSSENNQEKKETHNEFSEDDCPGGVCSLPNKRKMKPPGNVDHLSKNSPVLPPLDKLLSQLLGNVDEKTKDILNFVQSENVSTKNKDNLSNDSDRDSVDSDYSEKDEDSEYEKDSEYSHSYCLLDERWDAINKLLESHLIIASTVSTLIGKGHKSGDD